MYGRRDQKPRGLGRGHRGKAHSHCKTAFAPLAGRPSVRPFATTARREQQPAKQRGGSSRPTHPTGAGTTPTNPEPSCRKQQRPPIGAKERTEPDRSTASRAAVRVGNSTQATMQRSTVRVDSRNPYLCCSRFALLAAHALVAKTGV